MHTTVIGLFERYGQAEAAVLDLELAGIVGEAVEVISDVDRDETSISLGMKPRESFRDRVAQAFGHSATPAANQVHDDPGDMPEYIGKQEFYATHVHDEGAVMVVRVSNDDLAELAGAILKKHGSKTRDGKDGVTTHEEDGRPHPPSSGQRNL